MCVKEYIVLHHNLNLYYPVSDILFADTACKIKKTQ